jgi:methylated-DNA-[protein]-cysteine S-methyltransferase
MDKRQLVYSLLKKVPNDRVTTYAELARAADTHPRTVAVYMKTNEDPVGIPCFKVVKSDGDIGSYSGPGGVRRKIRLLKKSGIKAENGKISLAKYFYKF